jgi:hypothetical protein
MVGQPGTEVDVSTFTKTIESTTKQKVLIKIA